MGKLTAKQKEALGNPLGIFQYFDVWAGYWFTIGRDGPQANARTVVSLIDKGFLVVGESKRVFSGRQIASCTLTESGRSALSREGVKP